MRRFLYFLVVLSVCFVSTKMWGQGFNTPRWNNGGASLRGDFELIGNNSVSDARNPNTSYNVHNGAQWGYFQMAYIDVDGDPSTFQSSAATLEIQSPNQACLRVKWAGLYWGGYYLEDQGRDQNKVKFKVPGGSYVNITAQQHLSGRPNMYSCFADVTSLIQPLGNPNGEYMVANIRTTTRQVTWEVSAGWALYVVYEDIHAKNKKISIYDGYTTDGANITISGFQTIPAGPVKAHMGVTAMQGEDFIYGDQFLLNGQQLGRGSWPNDKNNFFDASITKDHVFRTNRRPASTNTLGFDVDEFELDNPSNSILGNNATSANIRLYTRGDVYVLTTVAFAVETITPQIEIEKKVQGVVSGSWVDFTDRLVDFDTQLRYTLRFRNIGNDGVRTAVLEDLLPLGVTYESFEALPTGVTFVGKTENYNNTGRTLVKFNVDPVLLTPSPTAPFSAYVTLNVKVQPDCANLIDFCSNELKNQAEMVYNAALDGSEGRTGSFNVNAGACAVADASPTNILVKDDTCSPQNLPFCGNMTLKGGAGFASWKWTKEGDPSFLVTTQDLPISAPGVYWVERTPPGGNNRCQNKLKIKYNVQTRSGDDKHPMRDAYYVTERKVCNNTGIEYLGIAVCNGTQPLTIEDATLSDNQVMWFKYNHQVTAGNCPPSVSNRGLENDPNWTHLHTGKLFNLTGAQVNDNGSEFAVLLKHTNCSLTYHFRAYKGEITYTVTPENIICGDGKIKVSNIPSGTFQYKLEGPTSFAYQDVPVGHSAFDITVTRPGAYRVFLRPKVSQFQDNVCEYIKPITIEQVTDANVATLTQVEEVQCVSNNPASGKMRVVIDSHTTLPVEVTVKKGGTTVVSYRVNNTTEMNSDFTSAKNALYSLAAGDDYSVTVTPTYKSGCAPTISNFEITQVPELKINNAAAKTITCGLDKVFTITVQGGKLSHPTNGRYSFIVKNQAGTETYDNSAVFEGQAGTPSVHTYTLTVKDPWTGPGSKVYKIAVYDQNNCVATRDITYNYQDKPEFNLVKVMDAVCGPATGSLKVNITNSGFTARASEYTIVYKLIKKNTNGTWPDWNSAIKSQSDPTFTGLAPGDYRARIYYTKGTVTCSYPEDCVIYTPQGGGAPTTACNPPHTDPREGKIESGNGPIRAFAGVIQLPCETPANSAEIRVANVSGGVNNQYEYKLDTGGWVSSNLFTAVTPGTHIVMVRNKVAAGDPYCEWQQTVQVPSPIAKPVLNGTIKYDCDGRARMEVTTDRADYSYTTAHTPTDGANAAALPTTPTTAFTAASVPKVDFPNITTTGVQTVRVFYKQTAAPEPIVLIKEDFGTGSPVCGLPGVPSNWGCGTPDNHHYISGYNNGYLDSNGCWTTPYDHTNPSPTSDGRFAFYNIGNVGGMGSGGILYEKHVRDIEPNQPIKYKLYLFNVVDIGCSSIIRPNVEIRLVDSGGNVITSQSSGEIAPNDRSRVDWHEFSGQLNPGTNTEFSIQIRSIAVGYSGNDLAIDDIYVYQEPKACPSSYIDITSQVEDTDSKKFKITAHTTTEETCNGSNDGKLGFTVANYGTNYKWRVVRRGTTHVVQQGTHNRDTHTVTNLPAALYTLVITDTRQAKFSDNQPCEVSQDFEIKSNPQVVVTQDPNRKVSYLNCDVDRERLVIFGQNDPSLKGLFNITGGKQQPAPAKLKYTIKVEKAGNVEGVIPDTQGVYRYVFSAGKYKITIVDDNGCNDGVSYIFEMKNRNKLASIDVAYTTNCNPSTGIGDLKVSHTWATTDNGSPLKYQWKKKTDATWSAATPNNVIPASIVSGWEKGVPYLIRARDEYICGAEKEVIIYAPIGDLLTADYTVVQPTDACPPAAGVPSSITVNRVSSANPSPNYQYAFVSAGTTPNPTDYITTNTKSGLGAGRYDIYIKDVNVVPATCGKRVATNVVINNKIPTNIVGGSTPTVTNMSATCGDQGGRLIIKEFSGKGPFRVWLNNTTLNEELTLTIPRTPVSPTPDNPTKVVVAAPVPPDTHGLMTVKDYLIPNLSAGNYTLKVYDEGNNDCQPIGPAGYAFTIAQMAWGTSPSKLIAPVAPCSTDDTVRPFAVKVTHNATPASEYEVVYRLVKKNGARIPTPAPWQTESATAHSDIAGSAGYAIFTTGKIGETYEVEAALVRKKTGAYSDTDVLCTTDIVGIDLSRPAGSNLTLTPAVVTGCANTYNLTVSYGQNATDLQFFLNHDGAPAEAQSINHSTYTAGTTHTFNNLISGRTYVVYARYRIGTGWCSESKTINTHGGPSPYTFGTGLTDHVANTCSSTQVKFKLTVSGPPPLNFKIYKKNNNGALTLVGTVPLASATVIGGGYEIPFNYSVSAPSETFVIGVERSASCDEWMSPDIVATPTPSNALTAGTLSVVANKTTAISCSDGKAKLTVTGAATGGVGPFTFTFVSGTGPHKNPHLRRNIQKRNVAASNGDVEFDFKESDFNITGSPDVWWRTTFPGLPFELTITDQATGCEVYVSANANTLGNFGNSKHKATYTFAIANTPGTDACDSSTSDKYRLAITVSNFNAAGASGLTFADYEFSIDGGATYEDFTAATMHKDIPALFDHTKIKVRNKHTTCQAIMDPATPLVPTTPGERYTYAKLAFTGLKVQDVACDAGGNYTAKFKAVITNGSDFVGGSGASPAPYTGATRYEIKVTWDPTSVTHIHAAIPAGTPIPATPAGTNIHNQDISVALPAPTPGDTKRYYTIWIKDNGNKHCGDYIPSAPMEVLPAEAPSKLKDRHKVEGADVEQENACTGTTGTKGAFEFTRNTTPASPAIAREDVSFEYDLQKAPIGTTLFASTGTTITDANIIPSRSTDPPGTIRYRVEGLGEGDYKLIVKKSSNGECNGYDVTNIAGNVVTINKNPKVDFEMTTSSPPNPKIELVQMSCAATTSPIFGLTPSKDKAQLKFKVKGGVPPYTAEVYIKDVRTSEFLFSRVVIPSAITTPPGYPTLTIHEAEYAFDLPDRGIEYQVTLKIRDAKGCELDAGSGYAFQDKVKAINKIESVSLETKKRKGCDPAKLEEMEYTLIYSDRNGNVNGYDVQIEKLDTTTGLYNAVTGSPFFVASAPNDLKGTLTIPYDNDEMADYRVTFVDKDNQCSYVVPQNYRVVKSQKPQVNLVLVEGGCGDQGTTPPPATIDLKFRIEVQGGDYEKQGYDYTIKGLGGTPYTYTNHSDATDPEIVTLQVPVAAVPANATTPFEVEVTVTSTGCSNKGTTQVIRPAQIVATSAMTKGITYCGGESNNDGEITVTTPATGGWGGPYQYQIVSNGVEGGWTDELTFGNLGEGSHYVQVRDGKGCLRNLDTVTFLQFNAATMRLTVPAPTLIDVPSCQGSQDGAIKLAGVTGGNVTSGATPLEGKLTYELLDAETETPLGVIRSDDNPSTRGTVTFTGLGAGTYKIRVYSDMLCADDHKDSDPIQVGDPGSIIARARLSKYPGCRVSGDITVEIDKRPNMRTSRANYKVELFDVTESTPQSLGVMTTPTTGTNGITGVSYEFAAKVKHGNGGGNVERKYKAVVLDNGGSPDPCEGISNIVIVDKITDLDAVLVAEESELNLKCFGSSYGKITVKATGGKADEGYNFKLLKGGTPVPTGAGGTSSANPNTQGVFEGLSEGTYQVEVSQTNGGCPVKVVTATITQETEYRVKFKKEDVTCNGEKTGKITITHLADNGGLKHRDGTDRKLTYAISPRLDRFLDKPGGVIDSLAPGKYFVIVQDENGCRPSLISEEDENGGITPIPSVDIIEFTIGEPEPLSVSVNPEYTEHESCVDAKDGKTRLRVFGGTPFVRTSNDNEYELVIDGKAPIRYHTRDNGDLIGNLTAGEHTFRIIDKNGCEAETAVTIDPGSEVKLKLSAGKYECVDGKIKWVVEASVTPTTAALNVRYLLTEVGNPAKVDQPHDNTQFNLDVDLQSNTTKTYIISVLHKVAGHGECRVDSDPIQVAAKEPLTIDPLSGKPTVSCHDGEDGRFEITAHGGSGKYNYGLKKADGTFDWQGDNNKFTGLKVGSYTVGVKDTEYNCIAELTNIVVESPDKIAIKQQSIQHVGCKGETNGKISYAIEGGNTPYKWEVYKEDGTTTSKRGTGVRVAVPFEITDLAAGKYMIKVTDAKDCDASKEFEIIEGVDLGGRIVQSYDCHASIDENNKVLVVAGGRGANSDTAAEATYDVYVSVNTPYLVVNPSARGAANRLRYAIGVEGGTTPIQRYEFEGTTPEGSDNTHNMYQIKHASLIPKLNAARALQEGLNQYKIYLYYFDKDNPAMSDAPLCESVRDLNIEYYPPVKITNTSISNDLNLLKVKVEGGKERYTVYFCSAQYHTAEEAKSHYVQKVEDVKAGDEVTYFVQKTDYEEENPDTGKVEKKIRVYVEDSKGELKEENGGKEACGHSVFLYKEFVDVVIPNFFTPNGDGQYDTWAPLNLASYPNAETVIYDRYGRKIATLNNKEEWDGTYGGEALPTGDYWFILRLNEPDDNRTFKGHFTLYR